MKEKIQKYCSRFILKCGSGTYVRSLARDLSYKLDTVGYAVDIVRIESGRFSSKKAIKLERLLDCNWEMAVIRDESIPPLRKTPKGTSENIWDFTAFSRED